MLPKKKKKAEGSQKVKNENGQLCSLDSADIEGNVARDGLRPGWLCVSTGMGSWRDDYHTSAGPPGD
jgi:hypothetical protein